MSDMRIDQAGDFRRKPDDKIMLPTLKHMQAAIWKKLLQISACCHRADRVGISPQQQCRRTDGCDAFGQILMVFGKPRRRCRIGRPEG